MNCPKCDYLLKHFELQESITLDLCQGCKGIWYDKGELGFQQELEHDVPSLASAQKNSKETSYPCPRCQTHLEEIEYCEGEHLLVDRCPSCEGIFLDRGELRKVEQVASIVESFVARFGRALKDIEDRGFQVLGQKKI